MKRLLRILTVLVFHCLLVSQNFQYSKIEKIPDLSFLPYTLSGLDVLEQMDCRPLAGKSIAVLCNQASVNRKGKHLIDILASKEIDIRFILIPEHGITLPDREEFILRSDEEIEPMTGARFVDLFGRYVKPPNWVMRDVDLFLIDIQDTGVRYTTYMTTVTKIMETAAEWETPVMVLDRPNPLGGLTMEGPIPRPEYQSFEAYHLVPIRHGLTTGEYSVMINEMGWIKDLGRVKLTVIPMINWTRSMWMDEVNKNWTPIEPSLVNLETSLIYAGAELVKGTNLSYGLGTDKSFQVVGAPWISEKYLSDHLNGLTLPGVAFHPIRFTPDIDFEKNIPLFAGVECGGVEITITDKKQFEPVKTIAAVIMTAHHLYPREFQWEVNGYMDRLFGGPLMRLMTAQGKDADELASMWGHDILRFAEFREKYLFYSE